MYETEFIEKIDCNFPYHSEPQWQALVKLGASISTNAAYMVLHEICRVPRSKKVTLKSKRAMLEYWGQNFNHPTITSVLRAAEVMIKGEELAVEESMSIMENISAYPNQYNALSIAYFACDDIDGRADDLYQKIISAWRDA